ncbi:hypothetical protein [Mycolicibacterium brumae]|uniref:hypothetical protein n=1 Tax=Mycolicibacterium brumae TaxID=85968 RepID=UPI000A92E9FC
MSDIGDEGAATAPGSAIHARGIRVSGPWGPVYGPLDLDVDAGGVTVLLAEAGSGRTALLLTLAGRMRPAAGELSVFGRTKATDIFAHTALSGIDGLDTVYESVTVQDLITEQVRWSSPWHKMVPRAGQAELDRVCLPVFGDLPLPPLREYVEELTELDRLLLRVSLANIRRPQLLVVGNLDYVTSDRNRDLLVSRLVALGAEQTVVTASVNELVGHDVRAQLPVANVARVEMAAQKGTK